MNRFPDRHSLESLDASSIEIYLRSKEWQKDNSSDGFLVPWRKSIDGDDIKVFVPSHEGDKNYPFFVERIIDTLSLVESRDANFVYEDLLGTEADVLTLRRETPIGAQTIPLTDGLALVRDGFDALTFSASAEVMRKAVYQSRQKKEVSSYLESLRLGHTREGSFIFAIQSPVPSLRTATDLNQFFDERPGDSIEPFSRRVTKRFCVAVESALSVARQGTISDFSEVVRDGVSANLCSALANLSGAGGDGEIGLDLNWAAGRPMRDDIKSNFTLLRSDKALFEDAANFLRANADEPDAVIQGYVVSLKREPRSDVGRVVVLDIASESPRKVQVALLGAEYDIAVEAHGDGKEIQCRGNIEKNGRRSVIERPIEFAIIY